MIPERVKYFGRNLWVLRNIFITILAFSVPIDLATSESAVSESFNSTF